MGACSIPRLLGFKKRWDADFGDICAEHDAIYLERNFRRKIYSDLKLGYAMAEKGWVWHGLGAMLFCLTFGTGYWAWKKYKP